MSLVDRFGQVLKFPRKQEAETPTEEVPRIAGPARCIGCGHTWEALVPEDKRLAALECPTCHCIKGLMVQPYVPGAGVDVWRCSCGNDLFYMIRGGMFCPNCGNTAKAP